MGQVFYPLANVSYSAPILGSTSISSGATVSNVNGLTVNSTTIPTSKTLVDTDSSQTLTNKTITSPIIISPEEKVTISASVVNGSINYDILTQSVLYYTSSANMSWTLNVRGNSGTTLNSVMNVGDSISIVVLVTQGATAYYASSFTIDGVAVTPKWSNGLAPTTGNPSSVDSYTYTIVKTSATPAYTVFASGPNKFA